MPDPLSIFVYGTLKTGQQRAPLWPHAPTKIQPAFVLAALYDLGPYPAITEGTDPILGELWHIPAEHLPATLARLDAIEGVELAGDDLYERRVVSCETLAGETFSAWAYFYARLPMLRPSMRISPGVDGYCRWPVS